MSMKAKELKELLKNVDDERIVILQKDSEGNGYSPLHCIDDESSYRADSTWSGEVGYEKLTPELEKAGYGEEDIISNGEPTLILVPVN